MPHDVSLIATIAASFGLALIAGLACTRLRIPPLVGYLLAGIAIGPSTPGFVADIALAGQLAEIGVMLLMFGVGLHFSVGDLLAVRKIAVPGAVIQIAVATGLGMGAAIWWGWNPGAALIFGIALSVASTVVLLRALELRGALKSINGQIAVGWLIVEDLAMVLVLVLLPPLAGLLGGEDAGAEGGEVWTTLAVTFGKVGLFVALMLVLGKRLFPALLLFVARTGSRELFTLCVVAAAIAVAFGSAKLFDVSFALGAFFAGMMMGESKLSHRAAEESLPLREAFSVLFFVSVGMLFDPAVLVEHPGKVLAVAAIVMFGKTLAAVILVLLLRYPLETALVVGASLAQIGEFSFILAGLGVALKVLPPEGQSLILAGALISISLNAVMFKAIGPVQRWFVAHPRFARRLRTRSDPLSALPMAEQVETLTGQVVLVGYGRVGRRLAAMLDESEISYIVVETNRQVVEALRREGKAAVAGDAAAPEVLIQAHVANAAMLVLAAPDVGGVPKMLDTARTLNPAIEVVARTHSDEETAALAKLNVGSIFMGEHELAQAMGRHVVRRMGRG
ncbi:MAG TPA: cation:proton antiporter [Burkholderiales bacterium]|nr:cation:proton antiporter [Burkholderiales bacterium]